MAEDYKKLTNFQIRSMIKSLVEELDRREIENFEASKEMMIQVLKNSGYTDEQISAGELNGEIMRIDNHVVANDEVKSRSISPKFKHPKTKDVWAGRGYFPPKWVDEILKERNWTIEQFKSSDEFKINTKRRDK